MGSREEELKSIIRDLGITPYFLGTFDKRFPGFISRFKMCCAIVNTAFRETGGVHWLAMAWHPQSRKFYMFDPFGFSDASLKKIYDFEYESLLRRSAIHATPDRCLELIRSTETVQGPNSAACGLFCCLFLHAFVNWPLDALGDNPTMSLLQGVKNNQMNDPRNLTILRNNQKNLYEFLSKKSAFFRMRRCQIERDTGFNKAISM